MGRDFSRALGGYDALYVNNCLRNLNKENKESIQELRDELDAILFEIDAMQKEIKQQQVQVPLNDPLEKQLKEELLQALIESSKQVMTGVKQVSEEEQQKLETVKQYEETHSNLQAALGKFVKDFM